MNKLLTLALLFLSSTTLQANTPCVGCTPSPNITIVIVTSEGQSAQDIAQAVSNQLANLSLNNTITSTLVSTEQKNSFDLSLPNENLTSLPTAPDPVPFLTLPPPPPLPPQVAPVLSQTIINQYGYDAMNCIVNANHVGTEYLTEYKDDKGELFYFRDIVTLRRLLKPKSVANNFLLPSASVH